MTRTLTDAPSLTLIACSQWNVNPHAYAKRLGRGRLDVREFEPKLPDLFAAANLVIARRGGPAICVLAKQAGESEEEHIQRAADGGGRIRLAGLDVDTLAGEIRRVAGRSIWRYEPSDKLDRIVVNKANLARRLRDLALDTTATLVA